MKLRKALLVLLLFFATIYLSAENRFKNINTNDGLESNTINCILKDKSEYIWLGLPNGVNRFDGVNIVPLKQFEGKTIIDMTEQDSMNIAIASEQELYIYNKATHKTTIYQFDIKDKARIIKCRIDNNKNIFLATDKGLYKVEKDKLVKISSITSSVLDLAIDKDNLCWILTEDGLINLNPRTNKSESYYIIENDQIKKNPSFLTIDNQSIYISVQNNIYRFDIKAKNFQKRFTIENNEVSNMSLKDDKLYIGTYSKGLRIISIKDGSTESIRYNPLDINSITSDNIRSFWTDGRIYWIGTAASGLDYNPSIRQNFSLYSNYLFNSAGTSVQSFLIDGDKILLGTQNGLIYMANEQKYNISKEGDPTFNADKILSIYPYIDKYLIGTDGNGLYIFDPISLTMSRFNNSPIFTNNNFNSITTDRMGNIWMGTNQGLIKYNIDSRLYEVFSTANSNIKNNKVTSIASDSKNRIWIGNDAGISYCEEGKINSPVYLDLSFVKSVNCIYTDRKENIWIGSSQNGLIKINSNITDYELFTTKNFLPDNSILNIVEDENSTIWVSTAKGIANYNTETEKYSIYTKQDGIPSYAFNSYAQIVNSNTLFISSDIGLIAANLTDLSSRNEKSEEIKVNSVLIDGYPECIDANNLTYNNGYINKISMEAGQKNITIQFSKLNYEFMGQGIYEYRLENDPIWHKTLNRPELTLFDVPYGTSKLFIRKAGSDEPITIVTISRSQPYYKYVSIGIFALLIIYILVNIRSGGKHITSFFTRRKIDKIGRIATYDPAKNNEIEDEERIKYQNIRIDDQEVEELKKSILNFYETEKPYLNPNLLLDEVANKINQPKVKISQILNQYLETNFADFTNTYRINTFKEKAVAGLVEQETILVVALECGFSSRSSFFRSFKKVTGQTPLEYLKDMRTRQSIFEDMN